MAIITKSLTKNGKDKISKHFSVYETGSISPGPYALNKKIYADTTKYDQTLVDMLEKLISKVHASKVIVTSWYRTPEHDRAVGGNGSGQHTLGKAVDIIFYDSDGKFINTKIMSCVAQDEGFRGIARISDAAIHLDMRSNGTYFGDEMTGHTSTVTKDFYSYFHVNKEDTFKYTKYEKVPVEKVTLYPKYTGKSMSIIDICKEMGIDSSSSFRAKIAKVNNLVTDEKLYKGSTEMNLRLINLLKTGTCIKP